MALRPALVSALCPPTRRITFGVNLAPDIFPNRRERGLYRSLAWLTSTRRAPVTCLRSPSPRSGAFEFSTPSSLSSSLFAKDVSDFAALTVTGSYVRQASSISSSGGFRFSFSFSLSFESRLAFLLASPGHPSSSSQNRLDSPGRHISAKSTIAAPSRSLVPITLSRTMHASTSETTLFGLNAARFFFVSIERLLELDFFFAFAARRAARSFASRSSSVSSRNGGEGSSAARRAMSAARASASLFKRDACFVEPGTPSGGSRDPPPKSSSSSSLTSPSRKPPPFVRPSRGSSFSFSDSSRCGSVSFRLFDLAQGMRVAR